MVINMLILVYYTKYLVLLYKKISCSKTADFYFNFSLFFNQLQKDSAVFYK